MVTREKEPRSQDVWSQRWADPALQNLGRWLTKHEISDPRAAFTVDSVWVYYSYFVLPAFGRPIPVGIAGNGPDKSYPHVWLYLPTPDTPGINLEADPRRIAGLIEAFSREVAQPVAPNPSMHLEFISPDSLSAFDDQVRRACEYRYSFCIGIFTDNLEDELYKIMRPEAVKDWLYTPNTLFAGDEPGHFLGLPQGDRPLRDLILAVKHGMVS